MSVVCNTAAINKLLFQPCIEITGLWEPNKKWGFLVHKSVLLDVRHFLKGYGLHYIWDISDYELKVGDKLYDMKLVFLILKSDELRDIIDTLIEMSQFTFYWNRRNTLFSTLGQLHQLKEFISINKLQNSVVSEQQQPGFNSKDEPIVVITFKKQVDYEKLIEDFADFINCKVPIEENDVFHYYFTFAFPWLQPTRLRHFDIPFKNKRIFLELQTFLTCMRELSYNKEPNLDFFELCSLKLAFCDDRNVTQNTKDLEFEIVALIERSLKRMALKKTYIKNAEFNLEQYTVDRNCAPLHYLQDISTLYFQYRLQNNFKSIRIPKITSGLNIHSNIKPGQPLPDISTSLHVFQSIKLVEEPNVLKKLRETPNARYLIDGEKFAKMNHKLFCDIISYRNVWQIALDTNYKWLNENEKLYPCDAQFSMITISLEGGNQFNFIEDFLASLSKIRNTHNFRLLFNANFKDYHILNDLTVSEISFANIKITSKMLIALHECNFKKTQLNFIKCYMENTITTWELLNELKVTAVLVLPDENTWQCIFEYISDHMTKLKISEFLFKIRLDIEFRDNEAICLNVYKFTIGEYQTKLEIREAVSGDIWDLYYLLNQKAVMNDDNIFYEFYK